jgi:hypothetical protein
MRYPPPEKLEIIRVVEGSHLSARLTLTKLGIARTTFYRPLSLIALQSTAGQLDMTGICSAVRLGCRTGRQSQSTSGTASLMRCDARL